MDAADTRLIVLQERTNLVVGNWINSLSGATNPIHRPGQHPNKFYRLPV